MSLIITVASALPISTPLDRAARAPDRVPSVLDLGGVWLGLVDGGRQVGGQRKIGARPVSTSLAAAVVSGVALAGAPGPEVHGIDQPVLADM
jgi:hypothetical protein